MNERFDLTGRTVVITGGGKGIGKVYTQEFAKAGARVVAADIDGAAAKSVAEALAAQGLEAIGLATDIASEDSTKAMAQAALERGNSAFRRNDWNAAAQELTRYIELEPRVEESMVWFRLGNALTQAKEHQRAIPALENFLKSTGGTKTAQYAGYLLGTDYEESGNAEKARQTYERALGLYPSSEFSSMIRGRLKRLGALQATAQQPAPPAAAQAANPKL